MEGFCGAVCIGDGYRRAVPARAQMSEVKEKPPMYSYVGFWNIPRAQWAEMAKSDEADKTILDKAIASGTIVGYGHDINLVHQPDQQTHDEWWSAMSMAGLMNVLEQFYKSGGSTTPVLGSATKHWDAIYVSRYYNWHHGAWKDLYTHGSYYKLKADAPTTRWRGSARICLCRFLKSCSPTGRFTSTKSTRKLSTQKIRIRFTFSIAANADGLDKVNAALRERLKENPLSGPAFGSMVDYTAHRDFLVTPTLRTNSSSHPVRERRFLWAPLAGRLS